MQARIAKECGFKGILLDTEQYEGHSASGVWHIPFSYLNYQEADYQKAGEATPRPFPEAAAKIRQRGEEYARAVCDEFPGLTLFVIPALYEWPLRLGEGPLEDNHNGLYPAFLDGLLLGLDENAAMLSGNENTYSKTRYVDIARARKAYDEALERLCHAPAHIKDKMSFAPGIWVDSGRVWSDTDVKINARTPAEHREAVSNAFRVSGKYAWLYGESSFFLIKPPTPLMREYFKANIDAHEMKSPAVP